MVVGVVDDGRTGRVKRNLKVIKQIAIGISESATFGDIAAVDEVFSLYGRQIQGEEVYDARLALLSLGHKAVAPLWSLYVPDNLKLIRTKRLR